MKYALLIHTSREMPSDVPDDAAAAITAEYMAINDLPGVYAGEALQAVDTATTVRVQDDRVLTTDGPFAEMKEVFAGFYLVDVADLDAALEIARKIPAARMGGAVEIRPVVEY
jgi:hypothetical protein